MAKELCVSCGKETAYEIDTHIDLRDGYIEGMGQLCTTCFKGVPKEDTICIPTDLIHDTPNDMELGKKVRLLYNTSK